jgi:hypothetical protein
VHTCRAKNTRSLTQKLYTVHPRGIWTRIFLPRETFTTICPSPKINFKSWVPLHRCSFGRLSDQNYPFPAMSGLWKNVTPKSWVTEFFCTFEWGGRRRLLGNARNLHKDWLQTFTIWFILRFFSAFVLSKLNTFENCIFAVLKQFLLFKFLYLR